MECFNPEIPDIDATDVDLTQSLKKGILTNLLNPNAYIFWLLIGGPLMATAADSEPIAPFAYAISFLVSIVLVKITIAYFFSKSQVNLSSDRYLLHIVWVTRPLGEHAGHNCDRPRGMHRTPSSGLGFGG